LTKNTLNKLALRGTHLFVGTNGRHQFVSP
jgi:hypothetical protein